MGRQLFGARGVRPSRARRLGAAGTGLGTALARAVEIEDRLRSAAQVEIDLGQQLTIDQGAVQRALGAVDLEALAERIETGPRAGIALPGQGKGVDHPPPLQHHLADLAQLVVEEADVEIGVVDDQRIVADEVQEVLGDGTEERLVGQEGVVQAVDSDRLRIDRPLRIDVAMIVAPGRQQIGQLQAADLDQPVAVADLQARGLRVENDLAHSCTYPLMSATSDASACQVTPRPRLLGTTQSARRRFSESAS